MKMNQKAKPLICVLLCGLLLLATTPVCLPTAQALTDGYYTYHVYNGEASISGVDRDISGEVTVPATLGGYPVVKINYQAFYNRPNITKIILPEGVGEIGEFAFRECTGLRHVTLPDSLYSIGNYAFDGCMSLTSIDLPPYLFDNTISSYMFAECGITSITIPDSVEKIATRAFYGCVNLTDVVISSGVTSIEEDAFEGCEAITSLVVSDENTVYRADGNCLIAVATDTVVKGFPSSVIPDDGSIKGIDEYAFYGYTGLASISVPQGVTYIGASAFEGCSGLSNVTLPDSLQSIGTAAFKGCSGLSNVTLPDGLLRIGESAFNDCTGLTSITIPAGVKELAYKRNNGNPFSGCHGLKSITVSKDNTVFHSAGSCIIETATKRLIVGCKNSVIPTDGSVMSIGEAAFVNLSGLTSITVPDGVTNIEEDAFLNCSDLASIRLPKSLKSIGSYAFYGCGKLAGVYYRGTEAQKKSISISSQNTELTDATWYYDCCTATTGHKYTSACDTECNICGDVRTAPHRFQWVTDTAATCGEAGVRHEQCLGCGLKRSEGTPIAATGKHTYDNACDTACNVCKQTREVPPHTFEWIVDSEESCGEAGVKHEQCTVCGFERNEGTPIVATGNHIYDNACDAVCNVCKQTREVPPHAFEWIVDSEENCGVAGVKHELCTVCGLKRNEGTPIAATGNHTYDNACDTVCNVCTGVREVPGHVYDNACDVDCNVCADVRAVPDHVYDNACDTDCNVCDAVRSIEHTYTDTCDTVCNICGATRSITHTYDDNSDTVCNVCGYERALYTIFYDGNGWSGAPTEQIKPEGTAVQLSSMSDDYYRFLGWSVTPNGLIDYPVGTPYTLDEDIVLYAKWGYHCSSCDDTGYTTSSTIVQVKCSKCGGDGKVSTGEKACSRCGGTETKSEKVYGGTGVGYHYVDVCVNCGSKDFTNGKETCSRCYGRGTVSESSQNKEPCSTCGGQGFEKYRQPDAPKPILQSCTHDTVILQPFDGVDYSVDDGPWQTSSVFSGLEPSTMYRFRMRYKANDIHTVGKAGASLSVFTESAPAGSITITQKPDKLTYIEGNALDKQGMVVTVMRTDGTSETVTDYTVSADLSTPGTKTVTVTYGGKTATFTVTVRAKSIQAIEVTKKPDKLTYFEGESIDTTGMIVSIVYDNGTKEEITDYTVSVNTTYPGTQYVQVIYKDGYDVLFPVTVKAKSLTGISVTKKPDKVDYLEGDSFDKTGMVITATYDNGTSETVTDYTVSADLSAPGTKTVTVTYGGKTATFTVTVKTKALTGDVNGDGAVTITDMIAVKSHLLGKSKLTGVAAKAADTNGDGNITITDFIQIKAYLLGKSTL